MSLHGINSFANPYDPDNAFKNTVYAYAAGIALDYSAGTGTVTYNVHPSPAAAAKGQPIAQVTINLGDVLVPGDPTAQPPVLPVTMPTLAQLMTNTLFAHAFQKIGNILDNAAKSHPHFAGSNVVDVVIAT